MACVGSVRRAPDIVDKLQDVSNVDLTILKIGQLVVKPSQDCSQGKDTYKFLGKWSKDKL